MPNLKRVYVLAVRAYSAPVVVEIDNTLEAMQALVGGPIERLPLSARINLWCNEEGFPAGLPVNRCVQVLPTKQPGLAEFVVAAQPAQLAGLGDFFIVRGDFFVARSDEFGHLTTLTLEDVRTYAQMFDVFSLEGRPR